MRCLRAREAFHPASPSEVASPARSAKAMHSKNAETLDVRPFLLTVSFLLGEKEEQKGFEGTNVSP